MSTLAELENEIAQLRKEVATLREEFNYVITVDREDDGTMSTSRVNSDLSVARVLVIKDPKVQGCMGMFSTGETGPSISLMGQDDRSHMILSVEENTGLIRILGDKGQTAAQMTEYEHHGQVVVFSPGEVPRAVMKGMEKGGSIAALSPDGKTRALLHSLNDVGEILVAKDHVHAKLTSTDGGGMLNIHNGTGERATAIFSAPMANGISIYKPGAEVAINLAATPLGSSVRVGVVGDEEKKHAAIDLHDLPGIGGNIVCRDATGATAVDLGSEGKGGSITVTNAGEGGVVSLRTNDGGGIVEASRTDSKQTVLLTAARTGALATVAGAEDTAAYMQITPKGTGSVGVKKQDQLQGFFGVSDEGDGIIMLTNPDNSNAVHLAAGKEGGRVLLGSNDGTTQASFFSSAEGSQLTLFNELGIERATLIAKEDTGGLHLRHGGVTGIVAAASERGGIITLHDKEGELRETLPNGGWEEEDEE